MDAFNPATTVRRAPSGGQRLPFSGHLVEDYLLLKRLQQKQAPSHSSVGVILPDVDAVYTASVLLAAMHVSADAALLSESPRPPCIVFRPGAAVRTRIHMLAALLDLHSTHVEAVCLGDLHRIIEWYQYMVYSQTFNLRGCRRYRIPATNHVDILVNVYPTDATHRTAFLALLAILVQSGVYPHHDTQRLVAHLAALNRDGDAVVRGRLGAPGGGARETVLSNKHLCAPPSGRGRGGRPRLWWSTTSRTCCCSAPCGTRAIRFAVSSYCTACRT